MEKHQYPASGRASQSLTLAGRAYPAVTVISPCDLDLLSSFLPRDWLASNSSAVPLSDAGFQASFGIVPRGVFRRAEQTLSSMSFAPATSADVHMNERTPVSPVFVQPKNSARRGANSQLTPAAVHEHRVAARCWLESPECVFFEVMQ